MLCLGSITVKAQPAASFIANDTASCLPLVVHFTNTSGAGATGYSWDLGNGTSTAQEAHGQTAEDIDKGETAGQQLAPQDIRADRFGHALILPEVQSLSIGSGLYVP